MTRAKLAEGGVRERESVEGFRNTSTNENGIFVVGLLAVLDSGRFGRAECARAGVTRAGPPEVPGASTVSVHDCSSLMSQKLSFSCLGLCEDTLPKP